MNSSSKFCHLPLPPHIVWFLFFLFFFCPKWHSASSVSGTSVRDSQQQKANIFIGTTAISGDCVAAVWLEARLCDVCSCCQGFLVVSAPASVSLAETSHPGAHAVSLWERVPGAGAHRCRRVWGSLQMCEEAGRLLVRHKTISPTSGRLCQRVSQHHVISLPRTHRSQFNFLSMCVKSPLPSIFSGSWPWRKSTCTLYLATTHTLFVITRHGRRMITWSFRMNTVMVGSRGKRSYGLTVWFMRASLNFVLQVEVSLMPFCRRRCRMNCFPSQSWRICSCRCRWGWNISTAQAWYTWTSNQVCLVVPFHFYIDLLFT